MIGTHFLLFICVDIQSPCLNLLTLGIPTFVSLFYDPIWGNYVPLATQNEWNGWFQAQSGGNHERISRDLAWGLIGTYKYQSEPITRTVELPPVVVQNDVPRIESIGGLDVACEIKGLKYKEVQRTNREGKATFAVMDHSGGYADIELKINSVLGSPHAKLLEMAGAKPQKFRMQLNRPESIPLKVPEWPIESVTLLGSSSDDGAVTDLSKTLAAIRYFDIADRADVEMALQERLIDRTKLADDPATMRNVCRLVKSDLLIVVKSLGHTSESGVAAKLIRAKTGEVIASAEAKGANAMCAVAELICRDYAASKK